MAAHDDIAASLPEPPPPAPARREAAIEAALRRFDGIEERPIPYVGDRSPWWNRLTRPQAGVLVSATLVALIGVPIALVSLGEWTGTDGQVRPPVVTDRAARPSYEASESAAKAPVAPPVAAPPLATVGKPSAPPAPIAEDREAACTGGECAAAIEIEGRRMERSLAPAASMVITTTEAPPEPQARNKVRAPLNQAEDSVAYRRTPRSDAADEENEVVITGTQVRGSAAADRGDWNACTVNDPRRNLGSCKSRVNTAAEGRSGQAATHLADGLSRAWEGDLDGAIKAFDQAIATSPRYAFAYLNRGLAYQRMGDSDRALADFNQAVRYDPGAARGYYHRGQLRRQQGDERRARTDEQRAASIDPAYFELTQ